MNLSSCVCLVPTPGKASSAVSDVDDCEEFASIMGVLLSVSIVSVVPAAMMVDATAITIRDTVSNHRSAMCARR